MASELNNSQFRMTLPGWTRRAVDAIKTARARSSEYRRSYASLKNLSERELDDIGIRRSDFAGVCRGGMLCR